MKTMFKLLGSSCLLVSSLGLVPVASAQCQGQICDFQNGCWKCINSMGFACGAAPTQRCPRSCTNTSCSTPGSAEAGKCSKPSADKLAALLNPRIILADFHLNANQNESPTSETAFIFWPGSATDPLGILSVTHDSDQDLFAEGTLKSLSTTNVSAYRVGWLIFSDTSGVPKVGQGPLTQLKEALKPSGTVTVGAQGCSPEIIQSQPRLIVFFVSEVLLANGTKWKASIPDITSKYGGASQ